MSDISIADKTHDQAIAPRRWTVLTFNGRTAWSLDRGRADVVAHLYADLPVGHRPTVIAVRTVRLPGDPTGKNTWTVPPEDPPGGFGLVYVNPALFVEPAIPISLEIWHNAPAPIVLDTRIVKLVSR